MAIICLLLSAVVLFSYTEGNSGIESLYTQYQENLRSRNVNLIAPGEYDAEYRNVSLDLRLVDILEVNEEQGYIKVAVWLMEEFIDPRLKWNPEEFGGVDKLNLPRQQIWIPDWEVFSPPSLMEYFGDYKAVIFATGSVTRIPVLKIKGSCEPLQDNHRITCGFKLGSWIYSAAVVSPILAAETISLNETRANPDWSIISTSAVRHDVKYPCCPGIYPTLEYGITLEKKSKCRR